MKDLLVQKKFLGGGSCAGIIVCKQYLSGPVKDLKDALECAILEQRAHEKGSWSGPRRFSVQDKQLADFLH